ncbi:alpha/beta hydrolase [Jongsikchunia kroppenstedtii]|uniref:alpha/beta hydrolase n=1 Tax=Jongsikchunia kroppenstedtii TaxID=1121721 RepID=UPI000379C10B
MSLRKRAWTRIAVGAVAVAAAVSTATVVTPTASATPSGVQMVYSPAMHRSIPVDIFGGGGAGAPNLYMLDGLDAPNNGNGWLINTDIRSFFAGKRVNIIMPFGGAGSFYTNWQATDPTLGVNQWETFLTVELPAWLNQHGLGSNRNGIAGLSMSGTSALDLASRHPNFYNTVASFSGYPTVSLPPYAAGIAAAVAKKGGNPLNMWGLYPSPAWFQNDPLLQVGALRGHRVYVSAGTGVPTSAADNPFSPGFNPVQFVQQVPLETAAGLSSNMYIAAARAAGAIVTSNVTPQGVHWWTYWQPNLHSAWYSTLAPGLGV